MNWELLLNWMTHVQEGSWRAFRGAVAKIIDPDADADAASRRRRKLWTFLSDLGHVDFFLEGSQRWRVRAPALAGLLPPARSAVLTGGRTPRLLATLADGAAANGCRVRSDGAEDRPACIHVDGDPGGLLAAAGAAGIPFIESYASVLSGLIDPIPRLVETAKVEEGPANWSVRSFDFDSLAWVEGLRERSACEFRSRYGPTRYYLHMRRRKLLRIGKREAVYAAAMLRGIALATHDAAVSELSVPASAPLPAIHARAACLCGGAPSEVRDGRLRYRSVPYDVAAVLLVTAGQPFLEPHMSSNTPVRPQERQHGQPV